MTQASLSPDLHGALGAPPANRDTDTRPSAISEGGLWVFTLMSSGLVLAAVLLLGLIAQNVVADASFGGFVSGIAVMVAAFGIGGQAYALVTARRQGLLGSSDEAAPAATSAVPGGMHVVPALPADLGRRRRQQVQAARSGRSKQAKAIATAATVTMKPRAQAQRPPAPRPVAPRPVAARSMPAHAVRPVPGRPAPARPVRPPRPVARYQPAPRSMIRMPRPQAQVPRPAARPAMAPAVRMAGPRVHPHSQAALFQVNAANVRTPAPTYRR